MSNTKFELDNQMLKKILKLTDLILMLNTSEKETKGSIQIGHSRLIVSIQIPNEWESFPLYTYQRMYSQLTYADLDEAAEKITEYIKYGI